MRIIKWFYDNINSVVDYLIVGILILMIIDVSVGVFYRYVLNNAIAWVEEVSRYLMIWVAYLSMGMVLRDEQHVGVEFVVNWLPAGGRKVVKVLSHIVIGIFLSCGIHRSRQIHKDFKHTEITCDPGADGIPISGCHDRCFPDVHGECEAPGRLFNGQENPINERSDEIIWSTAFSHSS